jgi:16S rRNA (guanine527-N7)-methyltransferase
LSSTLETKLLAQLKSGIAQLTPPVKVTDAQCEQLVRYVSLLAHWNAAYNLTAVRDPLQMISRHILDSLVIAPHVTTDRLLDVGTGPGIPGIPLAIIRPELHVDLLDSNGKKTRFMQQVKAELGLTNIAVFQARAEQYKAEPYAQIISRAFASLAEFVGWTDALLAADGQWLAMKGQFPAEELQALDALAQSGKIAVGLDNSYRLDVPDTEGERHLVVLSRR